MLDVVSIQDDPESPHRATVRRTLFLLLALVTGGCSTFPSPVLNRPPEFQRGVALGLFNTDDRSYEERYDEELREIRSLGATDVSLVITWVQDDVTAAEVRSEAGYTAPSSLIRRVVRRAHELGMRVMLFPILRLIHRTPEQWRGVIHPVDPARWFSTYGQLLEDLTALAAGERVEWISVGSEIVALENRTSDWERLIRRTREIFRGRLLYSANWDHFLNVPFWSSLDSVGISAYWAVTPPGERPTTEGAVSAWRRMREGLREFSRRVRRPLVFTEVGYPAAFGAGAAPWNDFLTGAEGAKDLEAQRCLYEAFAIAWNDEPMLSGVFFWLWLSPGGFEDLGHTPRGKPAELVLHNWYRPREMLPPAR